jgi:hypothetical protein
MGVQVPLPTPPFTLRLQRKSVCAARWSALAETLSELNVVHSWSTYLVVGSNVER